MSLMMVTPLFAAATPWPADSFLTGSLSMSRTKANLYPENSNVDGSANSYSYVTDSNYTANVVEWDWFTYKSLFKSSTNYYAYKVTIEPSSSSTYEYANMNWRMALGTFGDSFSGDLTFSGSPTAKQTFWLVTNYKEANYNLVLYSDCLQYEYLKPDGTLYSRVDPYLGYNITFTYSIMPYALDDLTDDILYELMANNVLTAEQLEDLKVLIGNTDDIENLLQDLIDILNSQTSTDFEEAPSDDEAFDKNDEVEGALKENTMSTEDVENSMQFEIDPNANSTVWDIVERCIHSHSKVFGLCITALSCGVIKLIFNR